MPAGVTELDHARRFISYGSDRNVLIVEETQPCKENASSIGRLISEGKGEEVVREIVRCHQEKKYLQKDHILFALAYCLKSADINTKQAAKKVVPDICQLPTDLFHFVDYCKMMSDQHKGWGRSLRKLISNWYNSKEPMELLKMATRYRSGHSWSHVDILRLSHINPAKNEIAVIVRYLMKGLTEANQLASTMDSPQMAEILKYLENVESLKKSTHDHEIACKILLFDFKKEHVPTRCNHSKEIWSALLQNISISELLNNIVKLASLGILDKDSYLLPELLKKLTTEETIKNSGVSPMAVLIALRHYEQGKGKPKWQKNEAVANALNLAFSYAIKNNTIKTKKRYLVAVKVSNGVPQTTTVRGTSALSPVIAAAGVAMILLQSEETCSLVFFSSSVNPVPTTRQMNIQHICEGIAQAALPEIPVLACDISAPIRWAKENKKQYDAIVILTDSKDSTGTVPPLTALQQYRKELNLPNTKLIICGMMSKRISYADPHDSGMFDIAGFDASVPDAITNFVNDF